MNVIIWQSYGNFNVYDVSTAGKLNAVLAKVQADTSMWGIDSEFYEMAENVRKLVSMGRLLRAVRELVAFVNKHCRDTDAFETFEEAGVQ